MESNEEWVHPYPSMLYLDCVAPCEVCGELIVLCEKFQGRAKTACHPDCLDKLRNQ